MESGCPGALTCFYDDLMEVSFAILGDEHFFDIDSQPVVDLRHKTGEQAEHVEQIGAWEVIHDELYFVNREGTLIRFNAFVVKDAEDAYIILDDEMKARREKQGLKRPESWEYTCLTPTKRRRKVHMTFIILSSMGFVSLALRMKILFVIIPPPRDLVSYSRDHCINPIIQKSKQIINTLNPEQCHRTIKRRTKN